MTTLTVLECTACGEQHSGDEVQTVCRTCGKVLSARYDLVAARGLLKNTRLSGVNEGLWKYSPVLPVRSPENIITLGESRTPLIRLESLERELGVNTVYMKDEGHLPTGSFKARGLSVAVSRAKELGISEVCMPSAGNAAAALAAYCARAGMKAHIFIPRETPEMNIKECRTSGAHVNIVEGTIADAARAMNERRRGERWFDMSTMKEPYRLEGKKTMGYELAEQLTWSLPDVILYPAGGGTGLIGMWKAFGEMEAMGLIDSRRPRMVVVQSDGCAPIVQAFQRNARESEPWRDARTVASGIRVPKAFADYLILDVLYDSKGYAVAVSDAEIRLAVNMVARTEGVYCCPEGAATVVALRKLVQQRVLRGGEIVVLFNTAAGNKYPEFSFR